MKQLRGVECVIKSNYSLFLIKDLSEDIKQFIREYFSSICFGSDSKNQRRAICSYKKSVIEFLERYEKKHKRIQLGMIGELLVHFIFINYFGKYKTVTPFFNMEEHSIKKGFDLVLTETDNPSLWITEVKSGEPNLNKTVSYSIGALIERANKDLLERLNQKNISLWSEAINGAMCSFDRNNNLKDAVIDVLTDYENEAVEGNYSSYGKNVILAGVLFSSMDKNINELDIKRKYDCIFNQKRFNQLNVLAVQKGTFRKVYEFLKQEASCEE